MGKINSAIKDNSFIDWNELTNVKGHDNNEYEVKTEDSAYPVSPVKDRGDVVDQRLSMVITPLQRDELKEGAKKSMRSISSYVKHYLKNIDENTKPAMTESNGESVRVTLSISKNERKKLEEFAKSLDRKITDAVKYSMINPSHVIGYKIL